MFRKIGIMLAAFIRVPALCWLAAYTLYWWIWTVKDVMGLPLPEIDMETIGFGIFCTPFLGAAAALVAWKRSGHHREIEGF
jgi:hypothetical protein